METPYSTPESSSALAVLLGNGWSLPDQQVCQSTKPCGDDDFPALHGTDTKSEFDATDLDAQPKEKPKRVYKKRKSTYSMCKKEKMDLETEITDLMAKLDVLQLRTLIQQGGEDPSLRRQLYLNGVLRNTIQEHHLTVARVRAMLTSSTVVRPTEMYIHLASEPAIRHETMNALREPKLYYAGQFITQLSLGLHPTANY
ncbi:hypothetical protein JG687_00010553 [Phytophthora cactorum]|uniref:Uncharacterized protein n=1 Tax=Phytophthora cactorum TaxID=29920 RepID=A0A329RNR7_9STRA|nr:hypothetical protein Pcac1_g17725 [Phytophthora cactorum]KAG2826982.1 hypothetical protein PC112_g9040 [Phytophthora cactorum]KAG2828973.1 hypothetical protein PC111_g7941 [Phytophthora cactorum]KAG2858883.1 hypothetical protein PC113_g9441 [Phytophthora cactorum]KAG2908033.1 hypothetical protein PC114_g10624 [Phytophthora cactorum]